MYEKNDLSKFIKNKTTDEIFSDFDTTYRKNPNNSFLNSTAYTECKKSLGSNNNSSYMSFKEFKNFNTKSKAEDFKANLTRNVINRMDDREFRLNNNVDILNIKFRDINTTIPLMSTKERFLGVSGYNKKAQKLLYFETEVDRANPLDVFLKRRDYKNYFSKLDWDIYK
jgi:hypothetical protein